VSLLLQVLPDWLGLVSLAGCFGVLVLALWVVPDTAADRADQENVLAGMWPLLGICTAALLATSIFALLVRSAEMSGSPITEVLSVVPTVLLRTHLGHTWILRGVAATVLAVTVMTRASRPPRPSSYVMLGCALVVSAMDSASGHASDAGDLSIAEIMDWLHLVAALVWAGGLLVLSWAIFPRLLKHGDRAARSVARIASRFSRVAGATVALVALTAPYQAWAYGGSFEGLLHSLYGRTVVAKIVLFFLLVALGAFNRFVGVPGLQEWADLAVRRPGVMGRLVRRALLPIARDARGSRAAARFARAVNIEALLVLVVLLCAALLRHEIPARDTSHPEHNPMACGVPARAPAAPASQE
jgi:putative copper resistance protein D